MNFVEELEIFNKNLKIFYNDIFRDSCEDGHLKVVKFLLKNKKIELNNDTIETISCYGFLEVIEKLLKNKEINLNLITSNYIIRVASEY
jgi:hypothetical protein